MVNGDVQFITKFDLTLALKGVVVTDDIDYSGLGENINNFRGVITVSGPQGVIYENTDFDNPDITPASSRVSVLPIPLPLDPQQDYSQVLKGNYTVRYTVKEIVADQEYTDFDTYSYQFDEPTIETTISSGPYSGMLRSNDDTDYGSNITNLDREHRIQYPDELASPPADIVSSNAYIEVTPIYTNEWTIIITTTVDYTNPDTLLIKWDGTDTFVHCVYGGCIDSMYDALETMRDTYLTAILNSHVQAQDYEQRLVTVNTSWHLLNIAYQNGDVAEADQQSALIATQIEYTGSGTCGGPTSTLVVACPAYSGGDGGGTFSFTNGLTEAATVVKLGGALVNATTINLASYTYLLTAADGGNTVSQEVSASAGVLQKSGDGSTEGRVLIEKDKVTIERADIGTPADTRGYEITSAGLVEKADYRSGYVNRSLISKEHFDLENDWGTQVVDSDDTLSGTGVSGDLLAVANPFPGFTDLFTDYGYSEPEHTFSEITETPTTIEEYGITDAVTTFLALTDVPASYSGEAGKYVVVNGGEDALEFVAGAGFVPATGGSFTGQVIFNTSNNYPVILRQSGTGGSGGTPEGGINRMGFQDGDGDLQGYVGINAGGDIELKTNVAGQGIVLSNNVSVAGNISVTGTVDGVDIAAFKTAYDSHGHTFASLASKPNTLAGYGITDAMLKTANSWGTEFSVKASATVSDLVVIEDVADSNSKKYVAIGNLPTSAATFLGLSDTPGSLSGQGGYVVKVNSGETAIEFDDISGDFISTAAGTLTALSEKGTPISNDVLIIEDSADSDNQKKILWSSLPGASGIASTISYTSCTADSTTNITIGDTDNISILLHYTANRDMGTVQQQSGTIIISYDTVTGAPNYGNPFYIGFDLDFNITADKSGSDIRLNIVVGNLNGNALNFDYRIYSNLKN